VEYLVEGMQNASSCPCNNGSLGGYCPNGGLTVTQCPCNVGCLSVSIPPCPTLGIGVCPNPGGLAVPWSN